MAPDPRDTLALGDASPALEGHYEVTLRGGERATVTPVFALLRSHLESYTPEKASPICNVHPDAIRTVARKVAAKRTYVIGGGNCSSTSGPSSTRWSRSTGE